MKVRLAVEDDLSEEVLKRLLRESGKGWDVEFSYPPPVRGRPREPKSGFGYLRANLPAFCRASKEVPHIVLVDLDDAKCPPAKVREWFGGKRRPPNLIFRVAVREVEAWLLADFAGLMDYLHVHNARDVKASELVRYPKEAIVCYAAKSRVSEIRRDMLPFRRRLGAVGPGFTPLMRSFARDIWDVDAAVGNCASLARALAALRAFKTK